MQIVGMPNSEYKILRAAGAFLKAFPRNERPAVAEIAWLNRRSLRARNDRLPAASAGQANCPAVSAAGEQNRRDKLEIGPETLDVASYAVTDGYFGKPYIDRDEERTEPIPHRNVHGGFKGSEEHTSELQSLMRNSYADFCLNNKKK